jgi:hypothetical protein
MDSQIIIPKHLYDWFESIRVNVDPSLITVEIVNLCETIVMKKTGKISELINKIHQINPKIHEV